MPRNATNIRLSDAAGRYLARIKNEGQSESSQYTARYALSRFQKAVATRKTPDPYVHEITKEDMDDYCYGPGGIRENVAAVSFNRYRSVLSHFDAVDLSYDPRDGRLRVGFGGNGVAHDAMTYESVDARMVTPLLPYRPPAPAI